MIAFWEYGLIYDFFLSLIYSHKRIINKTHENDNKINLFQCHIILPAWHKVCASDHGIFTVFLRHHQIVRLAFAQY